MSLAVEYISDKRPCQRCSTKDAVLLARRENYCGDCFIRFIRGKQRRLMQVEAYKVKYKTVENPHRVLLALSRGSSSLVLLDAVASLLQEQAGQHGGRQGFALTVVNVDERERLKLDKSFQDIISELKSRYLPVDIDFVSLDYDMYVDGRLLHHIKVASDFSSYSIPLNKGTNINDILKGCNSKSSEEDLLLIILNELLLKTAITHQCGTLLYGHSMTRLADEVLALTIKGRGSTIHSSVLDHTEEISGQTINVKYPLRDVLMGEIEAYCKLAKLDSVVMCLTIPDPVINKNKTVRGLTAQYFRQLDATGYSSTASTVVRTAAKLAAPTVGTKSGTCKVCGVEIRQDPHQWLRRITVAENEKVENNSEESGEIGADKKEDVGEQIDLCYGCTVTIGDAPSFRWPLSDKDIIAEYTLDSDED